ncbi:acetyl-CoA carboxylase biotin carboxyl carrier protein [Sporosarcina sp. ANT_H38]|uniref:acetyl-CoA carboxylase biotin carboxyl carrier protein n=1 Tax=Sporosarcina sp. ANT_H38 TaxID=2597358 RepID=UPI0011F1CE9A|nr:acetyl-CoA carboxylase biotin carboxyl carrier protein [Sporosarcina sp. ANT_H38]KAA0966021.1 acetyl-CoA carboxylase biotin carboxyl carrier protein [Sporosarcina sp. ANT_H38]
MLKIQEIREIIKLIDQSSIEKFTYESDGAKLVLKKGSGSAQAVAAATVVEQVQPVQQEVSALQVQKTEEVIAPQQETPAAPVAVTQTEDPSLYKIISPMVGTFYSSSAPDVAAYVQKGDSVKAEAIVCIVEAMKLFNEVEAEVSGEIVEILVKDGQLVEYGQPLFLVRSN